MTSTDVLSRVGELAEPLARWLPGQRWFAGKDRPVQSVEIVHVAALNDDDPAFLHLIARVHQPDRAEDYQLLVGLRSSLPAALRPARIGEIGSRTAYAAVRDPAFGRLLLQLIASDTTVGELRFRPEDGVRLDTGVPSRLLGAEQSNTSLVYGNRYILKLFRRVFPGTNPELELHRALRGAGSRHIARPLGSVEGRLRGRPVALGMVQELLPSNADGWSMATASVRDLMTAPGPVPAERGGDFAAEARRLGRAVAEVHADLRDALGATQVRDAQRQDWLDAMVARFDEVAGQVPQLAAHRPSILSAYRAARAGSGALTVQRIHGDLHLGQVLRTPTGWVLVDFEGEPAVPLEVRREPRSPLQDVAGMLRSFDYAAFQLFTGGEHCTDSPRRAEEWSQRNRTAFLDGYRQVSRVVDEDRALLRAFEVDKAVYEVAYEHANRPDWLSIPMSFVERLPVVEEQP
ncbi:maltokinase N-terminal cap-like domain-containing protein [Saccharopolyspora sp. NPDC003752]